MIAPLEWFGTADKRLWFGDWCEVTRYRTIGLLIAYAVPRSRVLVLMTRRRATVH